MGKKTTSDKARAHHERKEALQLILSHLRMGVPIEKVEFRKAHNLEKSRVAPGIDVLRNGYGFGIIGDGSEKDPYKLVNKAQPPSLYPTNKKIKNAYYNSEHWQEIRKKRLAMDGYACRQCNRKNNLRCHHGNYWEDPLTREKVNLFCEDIELDLITLCGFCHDRLHINSKLAFPKGLPVQIVNMLGFSSDFEEWLIPPGGGHNMPSRMPAQPFLPFPKNINIPVNGSAINGN